MTVRSSEAFITFVVAFAAFTDSILYDVVIPILPGLFAHRLGIPDDQVQTWTAWSLEAFGFAQFIMNWIAGYITDGSSSKSRPFILGLVMMIASTSLFFLSLKPELIIVARALQGASAALVWVSGLAFLVSHVSESKLGLYMGYTMMAATLGELAGPLLGGPFYDTFGYCAVFGVVELLLAADVILRLVMKDEPSEKDRYADTNESTEREPLVGSQWSSQPPVETENATAMACQADYRSASDEEHISRLQTLRWNWLASVAATTVAVIIRCGLETTIPLFVLQRFSWSTSGAGGAMFALLLPTGLGPIIGQATMRYGPRWLSVGALAACGGLIALLGRFTRESIAVQVSFLVVVTLVGLCIAVTTNCHATAISAAAKKAEEIDRYKRRNSTNSKQHSRWLSTGMMLSGLSTAWSFGMFLGPAGANTVRFTEEEAWGRLCSYAGVLCLAAAVALCFTWRVW